MEPETVVATVLTAAGGEIIGRIRLQKAFYLLEQLGLNSKFDYEYHHYGPYSRQLDHAVEYGKAFDVIEEHTKRRLSDGASYSIFKTAKSTSLPESDFWKKSPELLKRFNETKMTVLELAATAHFLFHREGITNWQEEIKKRKGSKTENGRLDEAVQLLENIGLALPVLA
jgi:uncharacterized protein